ncbi:MAG: DNA double-strand break repair nuclease NurA [Caldilineaceae bacterium]
MFDQSCSQAALDQKRERFTAYFADLGWNGSAEGVFERFRQMTAQEIDDKLADIADLWPGKHPTTEIDTAEEMRIPFTERWQNHRTAREWALSILYKRPSLAVDGSQITPSKDYSVPVGAVQVGWFVNEHLTAQENGTATYVKDVDFEVLAPSELGEDEDHSEGGDFPNWRVNQLRFVRECEKLCQLMAAYADRPYESRPLCFFDGSFAISFAGQLRPERAQPYLRAVRDLFSAPNAPKCRWWAS